MVRVRLASDIVLCIGRESVYGTGKWTDRIGKVELGGRRGNPE